MSVMTKEGKYMTGRGGKLMWEHHSGADSKGYIPVLSLLVTPSVGTGAAALWHWSNFEEIPHVQWQRRSLSKMVGGAKLYLESNPIPARDAQTNLLYNRAQRPHRDGDRTVWVSPAEVWASSGLLQGQRLSAADLGTALALLEEVTPSCPTLLWPPWTTVLQAPLCRSPVRAAGGISLKG